MQYLVLVGRVLYALIFIMYGITHFTMFGAVTGYAESMGAPLPSVSVIVAGVLILLGGISILLGYKAKIGAVLLFVFLIPTAFIMHPFWSIEDPMMAQAQMAQFLKNIALAGAALMILHSGSGPLSLDKSDSV
jgi:putative oxidoreductase